MSGGAYSTYFVKMRFWVKYVELLKGLMQYSAVTQCSNAALRLLRLLIARDGDHRVLYHGLLLLLLLLPRIAWSTKLDACSRSVLNVAYVLNPTPGHYIPTYFIRHCFVGVMTT